MSPTCMMILLAIVVCSSAQTAPADYDCKMRRLALGFAQHIQPSISKDSLQDIGVFASYTVVSLTATFFYDNMSTVLY